MGFKPSVQVDWELVAEIRAAPTSPPLQVHVLLLMLWFEDGFLNFHVVKDVISFYCLTQGHDLIRHETVGRISDHFLTNGREN